MKDFCTFIFLCLFPLFSFVHSFRKVDTVPGALYESYSFNCDLIKNSSWKSISSTTYYQCFPYILDMVQPTDLWVGETYYDILSIESPPGDVHGEISIYFINTIVEHLTIAESSDFHPDIQLSLQLAWHDERLRWDSDKWRFLKYPVTLTPMQQIWAPHFHLKGAEQMVTVFDHFTYFDSKVWNNGNVTAMAAVHTTLGRCEMELDKFPYDSAKCCFEISMKFSEQVSINLDSHTVSWNNNSPRLWAIESFKLQLKQESDNYVLTLCLQTSRNSPAFTLEVFIPMFLSAGLFLSGQLLGSKWKLRITVMILAIVVQLLAFYALILTTNSSLRMSNKMPKIYYFYAATISTTLLSLLKSLLVWSLIRRRLTVAPPRKISWFAKRASRLLIGNFKELIVLGQKSIEGTELNKFEAVKIARREEWKKILIISHALFSLILILIYIGYVLFLFNSI